MEVGGQLVSLSEAFRKVLAVGIEFDEQSLVSVKNAEIASAVYSISAVGIRRKMKVREKLAMPYIGNE